MKKINIARDETIKPNIYQVFFDENSKSKLSKSFLSFDNTNPINQKEFEYGVMRHLYRENDWANSTHLSVLSWKFEEKTKGSPEKLQKYLKKKPGYDIYIVNPYEGYYRIPFIYSKFENMWNQGEYFHPGMKKIAIELFNIAGLDPKVLNKSHPKDLICYCNYWIANRKFWDLYMSYSERLYSAVYKSPDSFKEKLFFHDADVSHDRGGYFAYIFERLFTTILVEFYKSFKIKNINLRSLR